MRLFLYYEYESFGSKSLYKDFKIFQGDYLDKRGNNRFKINYILFDLLDSWDNNSIVDFRNSTKNFVVKSLEQPQFANINRKLVKMIFLGREKLNEENYVLGL